MRKGERGKRDHRAEVKGEWKTREFVAWNAKGKLGIPKAFTSKYEALYNLPPEILRFAKHAQIESFGNSCVQAAKGCGLGDGRFRNDGGFAVTREKETKKE